MRVLVGCECSGRVRDAFRRKGHDAWSCDLSPSETAGNHLQCDLLGVLDEGWDMLIAHPDCTFLANSGVLRLVKGRLGVQEWIRRGCPTAGFNQDRWARLQDAVAFFRRVLHARIRHVAVENPVMHGYGQYLIGCGEPTQTIQPYEFGDPESKRTCLWLKNLPRLAPTNILPLPICGHWNNQTAGGQNKLPPSPTRKRDRSRTYHGIANAMAEQWGDMANGTLWGLVRQAG
jgi:hypothetical protein